MKNRKSFRRLSAVAFLALAAATQAQLPNVSILEVTDSVPDNDGPNNLYNTLAEVRALSGTTNLALAATPTATSSAFGTVPSDANDGNTDGNYGNGSVWHSGSSGPPGALSPQTFTLTFATPVTLDLVQLFGRTDCCQGRDDALTLTLRDASFNVLFTTATGIPSDDQEISIPIPVPEPSASLLVVAAAGLGLIRRRR